VTPEGTLMKPIGVMIGKVLVITILKLNTIESSPPVTSKLQYFYMEIILTTMYLWQNFGEKFFFNSSYIIFKNFYINLYFLNNL